MPELPEVEHVRRTLKPLLVGAVVTNVQLHRRDIVRTNGRVRPEHLLQGATVADVVRHGKDLAITANDGRTVGVHLGMSGWLSWLGHGSQNKRDEIKTDHVHCIWTIEGRRGDGLLRFRDPRRFGGLWVYSTLKAWRDEKLAGRGPDALDVTAEHLIEALTNSHRPIKAALLDQAVLAGVGNIYADESLHAARIHPATSAHRISQSPELAHELCAQLRQILREAIRAGGSTIRTYRGVNGDSGSYVQWHKVYGRAGEPCVRCSNALRSMQLAQRTTVFCPQCQVRMRASKRQSRAAARS